jgi:CPA2 family monovalent cation:H+ antiporter-2
LALGAFLVGLVLSESDYHHQAAAEVEPFRDSLSSLFFVSIGMLFDPEVILDQPGVVALALGAVVLGKAIVVWIASRALGLPGWVGIRTGLLMAQVGEFSFVLIQVARGNSLEMGEFEAVFLIVAVLSIALTPLMMALGRRLTARTSRVGHVHDRETRNRRSGHVVIVGFGPGGQAIARALRSQGIPYVVIEMNSTTVKTFKALGESIFMGDSSREAVLRAAGLPLARMLVLAVNDPKATLRTADLARRVAPDVRIVARTNFIGEVAALQRAGVREIVPQELETSIEVLVRVLRQYLVPDGEVGREVREARRDAGLPDRAQRPHDPDLHRMADFLPGLQLEILGVEVGSAIAGFSLQDSDLRRISGCTVVAIKRGGATDIAVRPDTVLEQGDIAVLLGPAGRIGEAAYLFQAPGLKSSSADGGNSGARPSSPSDSGGAMSGASQPSSGQLGPDASVASPSCVEPAIGDGPMVG